MRSLESIQNPDLAAQEEMMQAHHSNMFEMQESSLEEQLKNFEDVPPESQHQNVEDTINFNEESQSSVE